MQLLESDRLILRRFRHDDWMAMYQYLSQDKVVRYEPYDVFTEEECKSSAIKRSENDAFWAVCIKNSGEMIGNIYFEKQQPDELMTWELGYVFNPAYYGRGYATESCRRIVEYAFKELKAHRVVAMCNPENIRSWKVLERLGMRREGHLIKNIFFKYDEIGNPRWSDTYLYAILATE